MLSIATTETSIITSLPRTPHPDSILWRSKYEPIGEKDDILREQSNIGGSLDSHYHQFLDAGENTLNLKLACELYREIIKSGKFDLSGWLERYAEVMLTPGWHNDTYAEEYHRAFFTNYAREKVVRLWNFRSSHRWTQSCPRFACCVSRPLGIRMKSTCSNPPVSAMSYPAITPTPSERPGILPVSS